MRRPTGVYGDREVVRALREMARGIPASAVDQAAKRSMAPMLGDARAGARRHRQPGKTPKGGHLDQGMVFRRTKSSKTKRSFWIGAMRRARSIAHLLEFGTAPHYQPKRGIFHPGARAKPFLTPAFEEHADKVIHSMGRNLWVAIRSKANRVGKRR